MDRLLFNPRMMADVNGNCKVMNAELEVKKLQELVRKLERQNEHLRTRANAANNCSSSVRLSSSARIIGPDTELYYTKNCTSPLSTLSFGLDTSEESYPYYHPHLVSDADADADAGTVLDDVEILELDVIVPCDGESDHSWLYVSPNAKLFPHLLSPLQWCRHVLDNPRPEVELAKRSFCYRLDQAKRWRGVISNCVSSSLLHSPVDRLNSCSKPFTKPALTEQTDSSSQNYQQSVIERNCLSLTERSPTFLHHTATHSNAHQPLLLSPQSSTDSELGISELEKDSISMSYKLQDMTDVEVMARLQEESLRQDYATVAATCRSASFVVHTGARRGIGSETDLKEKEKHDTMSAPSPQLFRTASMQRSRSHTQNLYSVKDSRHSPCTPQHLNSLSHQQLHISSHIFSTAVAQSYRANTDKLQRSMPNLIQAPSVLSGPTVAGQTGHSVTSSSSLSLLRNSQSFDTHNGLTKIQSAIPFPRKLQQRVQSMDNFSMAPQPPLKATAYVSPTVHSATTMPSTVSQLSANCIPSSYIPLHSKSSTPSTTSRSALPRPAAFVGTSGSSRSKIAQPVRSLQTPLKSAAALSTLRDGSRKYDCY